MKSVRIQSYSGPYFPAFGLTTERYGVSHSFRMWENTGQNNSKYGYVLRSALKALLKTIFFLQPDSKTSAKSYFCLRYGRDLSKFPFRSSSKLSSWAAQRSLQDELVTERQPQVLCSEFDTYIHGDHSFSIYAKFCN